MYESMNYSTFLLLLSILIGVKTQNNQDIQLSNNQNQVNYSNWIINTLNNTSSDILWKNGLWQMYKYFKPITNFDKRWEPKFITFNAQDSTMTLDLNLAFPFIRIPVANTTNIIHLAKDLYRRERPLINFDLTGVIMVAMVTLITTLFSITLRTFFTPLAPKTYQQKRKSRAASDDFENIINTFSMLNMALEKYGVNTTACAQRMACMYVKNAVIDKKINKSAASHTNRIIEALSRLDLVMEYIEGTLFEYAIDLGRSESDCRQIFKECDPDYWFNGNYRSKRT